jgi:ribonuclease D
VSAPPPFIWVDTEETLREAATALARARALAVDTEADSFYHYFHKCCLVQISDGARTYLVDPLRLGRLDALAGVFAASGTVKVLHAAEQDVLYLRRDYGFELRPVFDTMIAAQLLGRPGVGLAGLLESHFGVRLDKGCQRDDWSRRPLTDRQKAYAAEDVRHLIRLMDLLRDELQTRGRLEWAEEEFGLVARRTWESRPFDPEAFRAIKGARDLPPQEAAILRALYVMRDERARQADLPPFRIVSDETLLAIALRKPRDSSEMQGIKGLTPLVRRRIGPPILAAVRSGLEDPDPRPPAVAPRVPGRKMTSAARARLERLREWRRVRAADLGIDPGVLFPQSTLEGLAILGPGALDGAGEVPGLRAWRRRLLEPEAAKLLA